MSRLDRFLVSNNWFNLHPEVFQIVLPKPASHHSPILLNSCCERWGRPFCFEMMWLEESQFSRGLGLVERSKGRKVGLVSSSLKEELLKGKIKDWIRNHLGHVAMVKANLLEEIQLLDRKKNQANHLRMTSLEIELGRGLP